jgi:hypothetical protein
MLYGGLVLLHTSKSGADLPLLHLLFMVAWSREGCTPGLEAMVASRRHLLRIKRMASTTLVAIKITFMPLGACSLLPGTIRMLGRGLLPPSMYSLEPTRRSSLAKINISSVGKALWSSIGTIVVCWWSSCYPCRSTPCWGCPRWQDNKRIRGIETKAQVR